MIIVPRSKLTDTYMLLLDDVTIFFDYFEIGDNSTNTVHLYKNSHQVALVRFDKGAEFMRMMGSL